MQTLSRPSPIHHVEWLCNQTAKKVWDNVHSLRYSTGKWQTDGRTERRTDTWTLHDGIGRAIHSVARHKPSKAVAVCRSCSKLRSRQRGASITSHRQLRPTVEWPARLKQTSHWHDKGFTPWHAAWRTNEGRTSDSVRGDAWRGGSGEVVRAMSWLKFWNVQKFSS